MYQNLLSAVRKEKEKFNEKLEPGCSKREIETLRQKTKREMGVIIPDDYLNFLKECNGLEENGLTIYGLNLRGSCRDIWVENDDLRAEPGYEDMFFLAQDSITYFVVSSDGTNPREIGRGSDDVYDTFPSVREMIHTIVRNVL